MTTNRTMRRDHAPNRRLFAGHPLTFAHISKIADWAMAGEDVGLCMKCGATQYAEIDIIDGACTFCKAEAVAGCEELARIVDDLEVANSRVAS